MTDLEPGEVFAGYTIERRLGAGGWGTVYLARDPRLPRSVAVKLLDATAAGEVARRRFDREAELTAQLDHPNIVTVYDRGVEGEIPWIAMQYVTGSDAGELSGLELDRCLGIGAQIAEALDHAHRAGVLHRDVKPSNILIAAPDEDRPERVLLTDFGIARLRSDTSRLTSTGSVTGTAAYVSPEQLSGEVVDHRTDQYSLACCLFVLLTGRPPFRADGPLALAHAHVYSPPLLLSELRPDLRPVDTVFARALAKRPADRYHTCVEFITAARQAAVTQVQPEIPAPADTTAPPTDPAPTAPAAAAPPPPAPRRRRPATATTIGVLAVVVIAVLAAGAVWITRDGDRDTTAATAPAGGSPSSWDDRHAPIATAFHQLIGDANTNNSWHGATCRPNDPLSGETEVYEGFRNVARISCTQPMGADKTRVQFDVEDRSGTATAHLDQLALVEAVFRDCAHTAKVVPHPGPERPLRFGTCAGIDYKRDVVSQGQALTWTFFPAGRHSRFLIAAQWPGHTVAQLRDQWWKKAPLAG